MSQVATLAVATLHPEQKVRIACLLVFLFVMLVCLLACLHQEPGKNSLRALVSEALELPPDLKAVGAARDSGTVAVVDGPVLKLGEGLATHVL